MASAKRKTRRRLEGMDDFCDGVLKRFRSSRAVIDSLFMSTPRAVSRPQRDILAQLAMMSFEESISVVFYFSKDIKTANDIV